MEITIKLNNKQISRLEDIKDQLGLKTIEETVLRSISFMDYSLGETNKGNSICVANEQNGVEKVIDITKKKWKTG